MKSDNEKVFYASLGEYADVIDPHPSHRAPEEVADGYPFLGIGDIDYFGTAAFDKVRHVDVSVIEDHEKSYIIDDKTIGYAKMGNTIGKIVSFPDRSKHRYAISPALSIINPKPNINPWYLRAVVESYEFWGHVNGKITGSTIPSIGIQQLRNVSIPIFPNEIQNIIGEIWKVIYDKISLNMKINENLESQAQAIFKSWFVDFEPFGGVKPEEWTEKSVYDLAEYINGAAFKKNEYSTEGIPIIKIAELKNGITDSTQYCCIEKDEKYYFDNKAILFSWSGNPETSIDTFLWYRGKAILNQHTFRVVSKYNASAFTYFLLKYLKPKFTHIASNKQTTGLGHVTVSDLKRLQFSCSTDAIEEFEKMSKPLFDMIYNTYVESNRLSKLRDVLLPKLMNGEIDVSEVKI